MMPFFVATLVLAAPAPSRPVDIRAVLVEFTVDASGISRACDTIESSGSKLIDSMACILIGGEGIAVPPDVLPPRGSSTTIKWRKRAAMVQFSDGSSQLAMPPEGMMRRAFLRNPPEGQRGVMLVEAVDKESGTKACAFFAPGMVSRFDPGKCGLVLSVEKQATDSTAGRSPRKLVWTNALVPAGDL